METSLAFVVLVIAVALIFDFTNGMHDAANSIATIVSTRVLRPRYAVAWAAIFNFIAFVVFGTTVAKTIGKGLVNLDVVTPTVVLCGLLGAILWNIITWYFGLPTSSSHALIGAYAGAAISRGGWGVLIPSGWTKTLIFIVLAPMLGMVLGTLLLVLSHWIIHQRNYAPTRVNVWAKRLQFVSAALYSLSHGGNDAQKTMGIITSLLVSAHLLSDFKVPLWVVLSAHAAIALGTLSGGWRIVKTMGQKIAKLRPLDGFCAETASAASVFLATFLGIPVSTTHVITGAISGVGAAKRMSAVRWQLTIQIVWAWILTIPAAGLLAALTYKLASLF